MELGTDNKVLADELTTEVQTAGVASAPTPISQDAQLYSTLALMIANKEQVKLHPQLQIAKQVLKLNLLNLQISVVKLLNRWINQVKY